MKRIISIAFFIFLISDPYVFATQKAWAIGPERIVCEISLVCPKGLCDEETVVSKTNQQAAFVRDDGLQWIAFWNYKLDDINILVTPRFSEVGGGPAQEQGSYSLRAMEKEIAFSYIEKVSAQARFFERIYLVNEKRFNELPYQQVNLSCFLR